MTAEPRMFAPAPQSRGGRWMRMGLGAVVLLPLLLILGLAWIPIVLSYEVQPERLIIRARVGLLSHGRTIALDRIEEARLVHLAGGSRTAGTAMPGFCAGRFHYPALGRVWQATSCVAPAVLLRVRGEARPVILSPAERVEFQEALRTRTSRTFAPEAAGPTPGWWRGLLVLFAILPLSVLALFLVAPGRLGYRVDGPTLTVRTLTRSLSFPLPGTRARRYRPERRWRMFGSGLPGYLTGWFRLDGKTTRVYASAWDGVLLEGSQRLFVTPSDVDAFLAAVADAGAGVDR